MSSLSSKRRGLKGAALCFASVLTAVAALGTGRSSTSHASAGYTISAGIPTAISSLSAISQKRLAAVDATEVRLLGVMQGRAYYKIKRATGQTCYGAATISAPPALLDIGCLRGGEEMPAALLDMSGVAIDPATGNVVRIAQVEGIAANEVSEVAMEAGGSTIARIRVTDNVYRFSPGEIPPRVDAIVALDASGRVLWKKVLG